MHVSTVDIARHTNVGDYSGIRFSREFMKSFRTRRNLHNAVTFAFEGSTNKCADRWFIFDKQNGCESGIGARHRPPSAAAAAKADSEAMGMRTTKVLPVSPSLFQHRISPPWARTIP